MGEHLGGLVVAHVQDVLDDLVERGARDGGDLLGPAGAGPLDDRAADSMPSRRRASAKTRAAYCAGSSTRPNRCDGRPPSTHSELMGATTWSGRYDGSHGGLAAGPVKSQSS